MRSCEFAVVNTGNTKKNTENTKKPQITFTGLEHDTRWKIFWITKKHKKHKNLKNTEPTQNHKNIKTKRQKDFNTNHFTDLEHGTIVEIYLQNTKTRKTQGTRKNTETTQKYKTENKRAKRSTDEKGFKP